MTQRDEEIDAMLTDPSRMERVRLIEDAEKASFHAAASPDVVLALLDEIARKDEEKEAQPIPECTRSHPHALMDGYCELRTEIARLTNENARLKAAQPCGCQLGTCESKIDRICRMSVEIAEQEAQPVEPAQGDRQDRLEALLREANEVIDQRNAELSRLKSSTITHDEWYEQCNDITRKDALLREALEALKAMQSYAVAEHKGLKICDDAIAQIEALKRANTMSQYLEITFLGVDLTVVGNYFGGQKGKTFRTPEDCYPDEPSEFEIEDILVNEISIYEMVQCCAIAQNTQPISHRDFLIELAEACCLKLDEAEPDFDEPDPCYPHED